MKKILIAITMIGIIVSHAKCMEEKTSYRGRAYYHIFNVLDCGCIFGQNIDAVKMNKEYTNHNFQHINTVRAPNTTLDYLMRQDPEVDGIGAGFFGININASNDSFANYFLNISSDDILIFKTNENTLTDIQIETLNTSSASFLLLIAANNNSDLSRFEAIINQLNPRIKVALSDRTEHGIETTNLERILTNPKLSSLFYLALHNLNDEAAICISECENLSNLVSLSICRSKITPIGIMTLSAHLTKFPRLAQWVIDRNALGDLATEDFIKQIACKETLENLVFLTYDPEFKEEVVNFSVGDM